MGAHNDLEAIGRLYALGSAEIINPGAGGTFNLSGKTMARVTVTATGTYTLPNAAAGTSLLVCCDDTSTVTLADAAGTFHVLGGASGAQAVLCVATDSNSWGATRITRQTTDYDIADIATHLTSAKGIIDVPLWAWREVTSNDITNIAGIGGVLATDSTPALEYTNGDTDSTLRLLWAVSNSDPIVTQFSIPWDMDRTQPLLFKAIGLMGSTEDTPVLALDTYFKAEGVAATAKIEDNSTAFSDAEAAVVATIAAADFPEVAATVPMSCTVEVTPGAHTTASNTITVYQTWFEYTKKLTS